MDTIQIIETGDGSHTLLNTTLNETYHSRHGALRESEHVFIQHGLQHWLDTHPSASSIRILEVGLGTGLNAWLTVREAKKLPATQFYYTSLEPYPLAAEVIAQLNYTQQMNEADMISYFDDIHQADWHKDVPLLSNFTLHKQQSTLQDFADTQGYDLIYFDAFAPNKQPELWELPMLEKSVSLLKPRGVWVTYSAKGQLKRDLKSLGLTVKTLPGPPGKAEMVRASSIA
uniref:tRNA (5-methylaminomethyl-2-thiouridine)(34)-methyltransferase MnmD n=1 Tax=Roseihalotalea indica TaxID=2867963 RepID=A0AA49Q021_9BACT|nr:tRNA (5-methylaminomethyl-2-thiouridine)(34)-methyltransferase MnmD [Tunicatimonas sp. TK19036]